MATKLVAVVLLCPMTGTAMAEQAKITSLMSKHLTDNLGKEVLMGGSIVMQLKGGEQVTLTLEQTF